MQHRSEAFVVCRAMKRNLPVGVLFRQSFPPPVSLNLEPSVSTVNTVSDCLFTTGRAETGGRVGWGGGGGGGG